MRDGVELTREMVETEFGIGLKQAKRVLNPLVKRGLVEFMRRPTSGHYRLLLKPYRP